MIYYIDPVNGNDANDGLAWASAWKTLLTGATFARMGQTDSDEVRIAKSPDPISIGNATWTTNSTTITVSDCSNLTVDNCETAWSAGLITPTAITTYNRQGTYGGQAVMSATNGKVCYKTITSADYSNHTRITLWINFGTAVNYTTGCPIQVKLCSDTTGDTPVNTFTLPSYYYPANYWVPITLDNAGALGSAIQSVAFYTTSAVTNTMRFDNITVAKASSDATSLVLTDLIAKSNGNGEYFAIQNIDGTTVSIMTPFSSRGPAIIDSTGVGYRYHDGINGTQTIATLKRECISTALTTPATGTSAAVGALNYTNGNLYPLSKTYVGGVNPATDVVDGQTWFDGITGYGYGLLQTNSFNSNWTLSNVSVVRYYEGLVMQEGINVSVSNCSIVNTIIALDFRYTDRWNAGYVQLYKNSPTDVGIVWIYHGVNGGASGATQDMVGVAQSYAPNQAPIFRLNNAYNASGGGGALITAGTNAQIISTGTITHCLGAGGTLGSISCPSYGKVSLNNFIVIGPTNQYYTGYLMNVHATASDMSNHPFLHITFTGRIGGVDGTNVNCTVGVINMGTLPGNVLIEGVGANNYLYCSTSSYTALPWVNNRFNGKIVVKNVNSNAARTVLDPGGASMECGAAQYVMDNWNGDGLCYVFSMGGFASGGSASPNYWKTNTTTTYSGVSSWQHTSVTSIIGYNDTLWLGDVVCKANTPITISVRCKRTTTNFVGSLEVWSNNVAMSDYVVRTTGSVGTWELLSITFTPTIACSLDVRIGVVQNATDTQANSLVYFDDLQVEQ